MGGQAELSSLPIRLQNILKMGGGGKGNAFKPKEPAMGYAQGLFDWLRSPKKQNNIPMRPGSITRSLIGVKYSNQIRNWRGTVAIYGTVAAIGFLYLTDWRPVMQHVPFYGPMLDEKPPK